MPEILLHHNSERPITPGDTLEVHKISLRPSPERRQRLPHLRMAADTHPSGEVYNSTVSRPVVTDINPGSLNTLLEEYKSELEAEALLRGQMLVSVVVRVATEQQAPKSSTSITGGDGNEPYGHYSGYPC